jgi:hypothetical protein
MRNVALEVSQVPALHVHNVTNLRMKNVAGIGPFDPPTGHMGDL